jgi:hypothetical protein
MVFIAWSQICLCSIAWQWLDRSWQDSTNRSETRLLCSQICLKYHATRMVCGSLWEVVPVNCCVRLVLQCLLNALWISISISKLKERIHF